MNRDAMKIHFPVNSKHLFQDGNTLPFKARANTFLRKWVTASRKKVMIFSQKTLSITKT
jgi:endonuclease YncB( thermonuclease family)